MNFARKIIDSDRLIDIIDLPEELKKTEVEIIVLPTQNTHPVKKHHKKNVVDELIDNPLKIENFKPFSRKEIYER